MTDINPNVIDNVRENAKLMGVMDKIDEIIISDVFDELSKNDKYIHSFDTIFWNHPWVYTDEGSVDDIIHKSDFLDLAVFDPQYNGLQKYMRDAHKFLKEGKNGSFYLCTSFAFVKQDLFDHYTETFGIGYTEHSETHYQGINVKLLELKYR